MRAAWLVGIVVLSACASNSRVARLEARLAAAEAAQARSEFELRASQARIEATLGTLASAVQAATDAVTRAGDLEDDLENLARQVAQQPAAPAAPVRRSGPDPVATYGVPVTGHPVRGKATALVTIVRAGEYACPYCEKVRPTLDQLAATYGSKLRIVYRTFVVHPQLASYPAQAACAAHRQGKFFDLDKLLWDEAFAHRTFDTATIDALALRVGLDATRYRSDVSSCAAEVARDQAELTKFGVGATPVFFINGRYLAGAQPAAAFAAVIDDELAKAEAAVKRGVKPARYYEDEIVKKGKPAL